MSAEDLLAQTHAGADAWLRNLYKCGLSLAQMNRLVRQKYVTIALEDCKGQVPAVVQMLRCSAFTVHRVMREIKKS